MSRIGEDSNKPHRRGRGRGRGMNQHGDIRSKQHWDLPTDFDGENSGFQRPRSKRNAEAPVVRLVMFLLKALSLLKVTKLVRTIMKVFQWMIN